MIRLTSDTVIRLATQPVDFRKQIDGLVALCSRDLKCSPRDGTLYVFINRAKTMIRILHHDGSGYWLATKRLSRGKYAGWPSGGNALSAPAASRLMQIIKTGIENPDKTG